MAIYGQLALRDLVVLAGERIDRAEAWRIWGMVLNSRWVDVKPLDQGKRCDERMSSP
jgi:hypothetical protein